MKSPRIRLALTEFLRTEPGHAHEISDANDELVELEARVAELEGLLGQAYNHIDTHYDDARQVAGDISKSLLTKVPPTD